MPFDGTRELPAEARIIDKALEILGPKRRALDTRKFARRRRLLHARSNSFCP